MSWVKQGNLSWLQSLAMKIIRTGPMPRHVAFIMDGNRRYANKVQVGRQQGHVKGFDKLTEILSWCKDLGVIEITIYAFSIENFKRSKEEVDGLMELAKKKFENLLSEKDKLIENGICIRVIGNLMLIPDDLRILVAKAMVLTKNNNKVFLNIALAYTSRDEMTYAIREVVKGVKHNEISVDDIDENLFSHCLYTYNSPNPDLLIRTSGEVRLSDFLMWQIADSCVYFSNVLWPEFSIWNLFAAIFYYQRCYPYLLYRIVTTRNSKSLPMITNNRVSTFISKLHLEREDMIKSIAVADSS